MPESKGDPLRGFDELPADRQYDLLLDAIPQAYTEVVGARLPTEDEEEITDAFIASRLRTVCTRLYLLGYLDDDRSLSANDPAFRKQVRQFQREAGFQPDGWVDPETWGALQELVGFEEPPNVERWAALCPDDTLLRRAAGLRLQALGFLEKQTREKRKIRTGLRAFARVAQVLGLTEASSIPRFTPAGSLLGPENREDFVEYLALLLDLDVMVERLAGLTEPEFEERIQEDESVRRFVAHVAKVELWLLGYGVTLDGSGSENGAVVPFPLSRDDSSAYELDPSHTFPLPPSEGNWHHTDPVYSFYTALYRFWMHTGQYEAKARLSARQGLTVSFFRKLQALEEGSAELRLDPAESEYLYDEIVRASRSKESLPRQIWGYIKEIGSRMWDGIRRAWNWFRNITKKVKPHAYWARNLARLAYRYALGVFDGVRQLAEKANSAVEAFVNRITTDSQPPSYLIWRDSDLDYYLLSSDADAARHLREVSKSFRTQGRVLRLGVRMLAILAGSVIATIKVVIAPVIGWFVFVISLVKAFRELQPLVLEAMELAAA